MAPLGSDWFFWIILIVLFVGLSYLPRLMNQRRRREQESSLAVGDDVLTIGGLMGTLVYINLEKNLVRVRIAEGVVVDMLPGAISGKRAAHDVAAHDVAAQPSTEEEA